MRDVADYEYDVFISYASEDVRWARALAGELAREFKLDVYLDQDRLEGGIPYKPQLVQSVQKARHMIVLWSEHAARSGWVQVERGRFESAADPNGTGLTAERRLFMLWLGGGDPADEQVHVITDLHRAGLYPDGVPSGDVWRATLRSIAALAKPEEFRRPIPLLLVTMTAAQAREIEPTDRRADGKPLGELLPELGIGSVDAFRASYGDRRRDWRPFGSQRDVESILDELADDLNREIDEATDGRAERFHWQYLDEEFWGDASEAVARRLKRGPAVVVIDPLAFYDGLVFDRYSNFLQPILRNGDALLLALPPFTPASASLALREALKSVATPIFQQFARPPAFTGEPYARCWLAVGDDVELWGWMASTVAPRQVRRQREENPYTSIAR